MSNHARPLISVVAPAYNEAMAIAPVLEHWVRVLTGDGVAFEIIIVDDGSHDGTSQMIADLGEDRIQVVRFETNHGYGHAVSAGLKQARGDYVVTLDSDGQFDLAHYRGLLEKLKAEDLDLVTGHRLKKQDSAVKVIADRALNLLVRLTFRLNLQDTNCALKVMKNQVAKNIVIEAMGFPTPTEIIVRALSQGYKVGEAPVEHFERLAGKSKLKALESGLQFLWFLFYLRLQLSLTKRKVIRERSHD